MFRSILSLAVVFGLAFALPACTSSTVSSDASTVNSTLASVSQGVLAAVNAACVDAAPIANVASVAAPTNATVASLVSYEQSVCGTNGQVVSTAPVDASTAAWVGALKAGLQVAAALPVAAPAAQ